MTESELKRHVMSRLDWLERMGQVLWFTRQQAGKINFNGRWMDLGRTGNSDIVAYIVKDLMVWVYFIELKVEGKKLRESQVIFRDKFKNIGNVIYELVTHPNQVNNMVEKITGWQEKQLSSLPESL